MNKLNQHAIEIIANYIARSKNFTTADRTLLRIFTDATNKIENGIAAEISPKAIVKESQDLMQDLLLRIAQNAKTNAKQNVLLALCQTQNTQEFFDAVVFAELENSANRFNNAEMMLTLDNCQHHLADDRKVSAHLKKFMDAGASLDDAQKILFNFELKPNQRNIIVAKEADVSLENLGAAETTHILKAQNRKPQPQTHEIIEAKEIFASTIIDADAHIQPQKKSRIFGRRINSAPVVIAEEKLPKPDQRVQRKPAGKIMDVDKVQQEKFEVPQGKKTPLIVAKEDPNLVDALQTQKQRKENPKVKSHLFTQHELFE